MFHKALSLKVEINKRRSLFVIYRYLDKVCRELKKYEESEEWSDLYYEVDEVYVDEREKLTLEEKRANILASIQKFQMKLVSSEREVDLKNRNKDNMIIAGVLLLIGGALFFWFYSKRNKAHQAGKDELSENVSSIVLGGINTKELADNDSDEKGDY